MTTAAWVLLGVAAAAASADWSAVARHRRAVELVAKPLTLTLLLGLVLVLHATDDGRRWWFVAALVLGLAGDVFLMLDERFFVAGLASFLVGHLLYIAGLLVPGPGSAPHLVTAVICGAAVLVVASWPAVRIISSVRREHPPLVVPVLAYVVVICAMAAIALSSGNALAAAGASLFVVSDTTLAYNRFVRPLPAGPVVVIVTYHVAQALLASSLAFH